MIDLLHDEIDQLEALIDQGRTNAREVIVAVLDKALRESAKNLPPENSAAAFLDVLQSTLAIAGRAVEIDASSLTTKAFKLGAEFARKRAEQA